MIQRQRLKEKGWEQSKKERRLVEREADEDERIDGYLEAWTAWTRKDHSTTQSGKHVFLLPGNRHCRNTSQENEADE